MSNTFFISDTHFGHSNIIRYANRPFKDLESMHREMIARWNGRVGARDTVYHLGDVAFSRDGLAIMSQLNGKNKHLVLGNHDHYPMSDFSPYFQQIYGMIEYKGYWLTHVPMALSPLDRRRNIHGHTHQHNVIGDQRYINVSVENIDYRPVMLQEIMSGDLPRMNQQKNRNRLELPLNTLGKDYVVGDIHGAFDQLEQALIAIGFDKSQDRLISVGDLVDRGTDSLKALDYLNEPWFYAVLGNHDWTVAWDNSPQFRISNHNPGDTDWALGIRDTPAYQQLSDRMKRLPLLIEVTTRAGKIGVVHAEVRPTYQSWQEVVERADSYITTESAQESFMLTGRARIRKRAELDWARRVEGVDYVISGHSVVNQYELIGNSLFIDAGLVYGINPALADKKPAGLSLVELESMRLYHFTAQQGMMNSQPIIHEVGNA